MMKETTKSEIRLSDVNAPVTSEELTYFLMTQASSIVGDETLQAICAILVARDADEPHAAAYFSDRLHKMTGMSLKVTTHQSNGKGKKVKREEIPATHRAGGAEDGEPLTTE